MKGYTVAAIAMLAAIASSRANASAYTYDMNGIDGITGVITTNCDNCVLNASDVTAWSLMSPGLPAPAVSVSSAAAGSQLVVQGSALSATPNAVTFQFTPSSTTGIVEFFSNNQSIDFLNFGTFASAPYMFPNGIGEIDTCGPGSFLKGGECFSNFLGTGTQPIARATAAAAPEMDPRSFTASLTILFGALAVLRGRRTMSLSATTSRVSAAA
jgi:hypothetical protein